MSDLWDIVVAVIAELGRSDAEGNIPHAIYCWLATSGAHVGMGMGLALALIWWHMSRVPEIRARVPFALLCLWAVKELAFDLFNGNFTLWTWADSAFDLSCGALGFWFARRALRKVSGSDFHNEGNQPLNPAVAP